MNPVTLIQTSRTQFKSPALQETKDGAPKFNFKGRATRPSRSHQQQRLSRGENLLSEIKACTESLTFLPSLGR